MMRCVNEEINSINNTETMENLKQQLLEHIADLIDDDNFGLDMALLNLQDPEPIHKSNLHLLMADASFKVFCEYFNKQDKTEQCIINGVSQQRELLLAFVDYYCTLEGVNYLPEKPEKLVSDFIANNCG